LGTAALSIPAFDDATVKNRDGGIDEIASQSPQAGQNAVLVGACQTAVADYIGRQNGG
jgi:hypothetical protein